MDTKQTELLIEVVKDMVSNLSVEAWEKPWFDVKYSSPMNIKGNLYSGWNAIYLMMKCTIKKWELPVFLTFNQAKEMGLQVQKGEKSSKVFFYNFVVKHKERKSTIELSEYKKLSEKEKEEYYISRFLKEFSVFNIDQTNLKEVNVALWEKMKNESVEIKKFEGENIEEIDSLISDWICQIDIRKSEKAFFWKSFTDSGIVMPLREQFKDNNAFYGTLLHEMAHSTQLEIKRDCVKGNKQHYAIEELRAEISAAILLVKRNIYTTIDSQNIAYIQSWKQRILDTDIISKITEDIISIVDFIEGRIEKKEA